MNGGWCLLVIFLVFFVVVVVATISLQHQHQSTENTHTHIHSHSDDKSKNEVYRLRTTKPLNENTTPMEKFGERGAQR